MMRRPRRSRPRSRRRRARRCRSRRACRARATARRRAADRRARPRRPTSAAADVGAGRRDHARREGRRVHAVLGRQDQVALGRHAPAPRRRPPAVQHPQVVRDVTERGSVRTGSRPRPEAPERRHQRRDDAGEAHRLVLDLADGSRSYQGASPHAAPVAASALSSFDIIAAVAATASARRRRRGERQRRAASRTRRAKPSSGGQRARQQQVPDVLERRACARAARRRGRRRPGGRRWRRCARAGSRRR